MHTQLQTLSSSLLFLAGIVPTTSASTFHEKCLAFKPLENDTDPLVLSSGSQDATIRLWNIEPFSRTTLSASGSTSKEADDLLDAFEASLVNLEDTEDGGRSISLKRHILTVKSTTGKSVFSTCPQISRLTRRLVLNSSP